MAVTTPTTTSFLSAAATTGPVTKPAGIVDGDVLYAFCSTSAGVAMTAPSTAIGAWTHVTALSQSALFNTDVYILPVPTASLLTDTSFTFTQAGNSGVVNVDITIFRGAVCSAATPLNFIDSTGAYTANVTTTTTTTATAAVSSVAMLVCQSTQVSGASATTNTSSVASMTIQSQTSTPNTTGYFNNVLATQQLAAAGTTGTRLVTYSAAPGTGARAVLFTVAPGAVPVTVTGVVALEATAAPAGTVAGGTGKTVTGVVALEATAAPAGTVTASSTLSVTLAPGGVYGNGTYGTGPYGAPGLVAAANFDAPAGTVTVIVAVAVVGPVANSTAAAPVGTVGGVGAVTVFGSTAAVVFAAPPGGTGLQIAGVTARLTVTAWPGVVRVPLPVQDLNGQFKLESSSRMYRLEKGMQIRQSLGEWEIQWGRYTERGTDAVTGLPLDITGMTVLVSLGTGLAPGQWLTPDYVQYPTKQVARVGLIIGNLYQPPVGSYSMWISVAGTIEKVIEPATNAQIIVQ